MSTFKERETPLEKTEDEELKTEPDDGNKQGPSDKGNDKKAPLGEGEDTDDELGKMLNVPTAILLFHTRQKIIHLLQCC